MLKQITQLEHVIANKAYKFICEIDSSIPHVLESLEHMQTYVRGLESQIKAAMPPVSSESVPTPVSPEVKEPVEPAQSSQVL